MENLQNPALIRDGLLAPLPHSCRLAWRPRAKPVRNSENMRIGSCAPAGAENSDAAGPEILAAPARSDTHRPESRVGFDFG